MMSETLPKAAGPVPAEPVPATWVKPTVEVVELGCEVTSYVFRR
jgi:coenzyme PQQ precursor peptide PqqA